MSKHFKQSKTIQGAIKAQTQTALAAPIGGAIALGAEILISEIGASESINDAIRSIAQGAANGDDLKTIAINATIIALMGVAAKSIAFSTAKQTIKGRIEASEEIATYSIPKRFS